MTKRGGTHSDEARAKMVARLADPDVKARHRDACKRAWADPEKRRLASERAKAINNEPAMRAKISQRTKEGNLAAAGMAPEIVALRAAWAGARPEIRRLFLAELLQPVIGEGYAG